MAQDFYKKGGSYFTSGGQKVANPTELQNLAKAGGQEIAMPTAPQGATKIASPDQLTGLNESQIFRQGQDIYRLPTIDTTLDPITPTPDVPEPEAVDDISGLMAGLDTGTAGTKALLEQINKPQPQETEIDKRLKQTSDLTEQKAGVQETALSRAEEFGLTENVKNLQQILPQIERLKAQFDNYSIAQEGRVASASSIYGRQALAQRQSAVELAGLGAIAQAYQGNIQLATQTAQQMVDMELAPIQTRIDNQMFQLEQVKDQLTDAQARKAQSLELVLNERQRLVDEEKEKKTNIANLAITAAQNGASQDIVKSIMSSTDYTQAITRSKDYLDINTENNIPQKIGEDSNGNDLYYDPSTKTVKTAGQLTAFQLGQQVGTIKGLPSYDTRSTNPGVNRSDRNNNPGNIKVSDYTKEFDGVAGVESNPAEDGGHFLIFENSEAGLNAMGRLLLEGKSYQGVNAETAIKKYNGGGAYGATDVGLDPNADFQSQIQDPAKRLSVVNAIAKAEGWKGLGTTIDSEFDMKEYEGIRQKVFNNQGTADAAKTVVRDFEEALNMMTSPIFQTQTYATAAQRTFLKNIPGSPVYEINALIESAKSNIGIDKLLEIKASGAGLGQVPQSQLETLQSVLGRMDVSRDPALLKRDIKEAVSKYNDVITRTTNENNTLAKQYPQYTEALNLDMSGQGVSVAPSGISFGVDSDVNLTPSGLKFEIVNE